MGLTTALYTGLTGLNANQFSVDTIGNNVANMNTTAFKASRATFENQFCVTLSAGSPPGTTTGGTNPMQIGLGTLLGSVQRLFTSGAIETTGVRSDMAIEGNGFFIVAKSDNKQAFTRDGSMKLDSKNNLVTQQGYYVQGFDVDQDFNIIPGTLTNLNIPVGTLSIAKATENASFDGNLDAGSAVGDAVSTSFVTYDSLGNPQNIGLTLTLDHTAADGVYWSWAATSPPGTTLTQSGDTLLHFDTDGQLVAPTAVPTIQVAFNDTGAATPMQVAFDFDTVTSLAAGSNAGAGNATQSVLVMTTQDGFAAGTLKEYSIGGDGTIMGTFSNGLQRTLGQVALATFANPDGLVAETNNTYALGPNSGEPVITAPLTLGAGRILGGSLELSNVDLTREFIGLVTASTGFSASGRVITTSSDMLRELLTLTR
jgi:flagellar hook protein FlgE